MAFKVLHCLLLFLRRSFCLKGAEISSFTVFGFFLREDSRYFPDFSFLIIAPLDILPRSRRRALNCRATPECFRGCRTNRRQPAASAQATAAKERLPYIPLAERSENQSATNAARIPRLVARCAGKLQCWLA